MDNNVRPLNKHLVLVINGLCTRLTGGLSVGPSNLRPGASLGFVEQIFYNEVFGTVVYPDIFHRAAAYLFYTVKDHVFIDGNKRTGLACALTFLQWNNIPVRVEDEAEAYDLVMTVAAGPNDPEDAIPGIAAWLEQLPRVAVVPSGLALGPCEHLDGG